MEQAGINHVPVNLFMWEELLVISLQLTGFSEKGFKVIPDNVHRYINPALIQADPFNYPIAHLIGV